MISLKKSFIYKDLCYLMILWSVKLPSETIYRPLHETMIVQLKQLKIKDLLLKQDDPMYFI